MPVERFLAALSEVAKSPLALIGYVVLIGAWTYVAVARHRLHRIAQMVRDIPEGDRASLLQREYAIFPRSGLSAEQWLRSQRHRLAFLAFLSLVIAITILVTITIVSTPRQQATTGLVRPVDWQMFLYLGEVGAFGASDTTFGKIACEDGVAKGIPIHIPRGTTFQLAGVIKLIVDNVYHTNKGLIYPIGLTTTWDRRVYTVYDGLDAEAERAVTTKFTRTLYPKVTLQAPDAVGKQYVVIMSGAALDAKQLFTFRADEGETPSSFWSVPVREYEGANCTGWLRHEFVRNDAVVERPSFPILAIPIDVN